MKRTKTPKPSLEPQAVKKDRAWYYETRRGIELVTQKRDPDGAFVSGAITLITWTRLIKSAKRCGYNVTRRKPAP